MSEDSSQGASPVAGQRFLWSRPELLTPEAHGKLGITPCDAPFAFAAGTRAIPLTMAEFRTAQHHYPIVFTDLDNPAPVAALGLREERNLFMDEAGRWEPSTYIPAYLRSHPFALAKASDDRFAVVIDRDAPAISEEPATPFFVDGKLSDPVRRAVDFCQNVDVETMRTRQFCERLKELELLTRQSMRRTDSEENVVQYCAVSTEKLDGLAAADLEELFRKGWLAAIFAHLFSLDMWNSLLRRQNS